MTLVMADSVTVADLPPGLDFYAGYISGRYANATQVQARFPHATVLTIATSAVHDADCLDVEQGDAVPGDAPAWVRRQQARGITRPVVYSGQASMPAVLAALGRAGIDRDAVRVWTAHYTYKPHICSPTACGAQGFTADGTQWADDKLGLGHYDSSLLAAGFFGAPPAPIPAPAPVQEDDDMPGLIAQAKGDTKVYLVNPAVGTKLYRPTQNDINIDVFLGAKAVQPGNQPFTDQDPAWMASLHTLPNGG